MEYYKTSSNRPSKRSAKEGKDGKHRKSLFWILGFSISAIVFLGIAGLFLLNKDDQAAPGMEPSLKEIVMTVASGRTPRLYAVIIEKNGKEYRMTKGDSFEVTYRDEFVVKEVVTDALFKRWILVKVEGLNSKEGGFRELIKGIDLVNQVMAAEADMSHKTAYPKFVIQVYYRNAKISEIPITIVVTPQDWLRNAKGPSGDDLQIPSLKRAIELNKQDINVRKLLAAAYARQGMTDQAISEYQVILNQRPDDPASLIEVAGLYFEKKRYDDALAVYRDIIKKNPKDASAYANAGLTSGKLGKWSQAVSYYQDSLKLNPENASIHLKLAEALEKTGKAVDAAEQYKVYLRQKPGDLDSMTALGDIYLKSNRYEDAVRTFSEIIKKNPAHMEALNGLGLAYGGKGQAKDEIESYRKALSIKPRDPVIRYNLALALAKGKHNSEAETELEQVLKLKPNDSEAMLKLADLYSKDKKYPKAIQIYDNALKASPKNGSVYSALGYLFGEMKQYRQSAAYYEKALQFGCRDPQINYNLGFTYEKLGDTKRSIEAFERFASERQNLEVLTILANEYMKQKRYSEAIRIYEKMTKVNPRRAEIYSSLGSAYGLKGDIDREIENYRIALRYDREDDTTHFNLGNAYERKRMYTEALKEYTVAYEINPESNKAAKKIPQMKIKILQQKYKEKE